MQLVFPAIDPKFISLETSALKTKQVFPFLQTCLYLQRNNFRFQIN